MGVKMTMVRELKLLIKSFGVFPVIIASLMSWKGRKDRQTLDGCR